MCATIGNVFDSFTYEASATGACPIPFKTSLSKIRAEVETALILLERLLINTPSASICVRGRVRVNYETITANQHYGATQHVEGGCKLGAMK